jgi:sugar phosphate isomerase/epimerase
MMNNLTDCSRLCIHTITTKPWNIQAAVDNYADAGVKGISVWRNVFDNTEPQQVGELLKNSDLSIISLVRGGFFPGETAEKRQAAIDDNKKALEEAAAAGAPLMVLVCGAIPGQSLEESRDQIQQGIEAILSQAHKLNIKLGIEPLHPMYADDRSAINTLKQANDLCDAIGDPSVGVVVDVYHLWWDQDLQQEIARCGREGRLFAFHVCDWKTPTEDLLNDRGLMGEGCIPIRQIRDWVEEAGFNGFVEVEIFSNLWWQKDQRTFLEAIKKAYLEHV